MANKLVEEIILKVSMKTDAVAKGSKEIPKAKKKVKALGTQIKITSNEAVRDFRTMSKSFDEGSKRMSSRFTKLTKKSSLLNDAFRAISAAVIIAELKELGAEAINISRQFERIERSMETTFGGEAGAQIAFVNKEAEKLGINAVSAQEGYSKIAASAKAAGLSTKVVQDIFIGTSEAAAALSLGDDDTNGIFRALGQIASKGKVSTEEILQIAERLPGTYAIAAESMGLTTAEMSKMLEQGEIMSNDFLPRFAQQLSSTFHDGAMKNANGEIAQSTRNLNKYNDQMKLAGDELKVFTTGAGTAAIKVWEGMTDVIGEGIFQMGEVLGVTESMAGSTKKATEVNKAFTESEKNKKTALEKSQEAFQTANEILNKFSLSLSQTNSLDKLRDSLGLTAKGFSKIKGPIDQMLKSGLKIKEITDPIQQLVEVLKSTKELSDDDLIKSEDVKRAEKITAQVEKWVGSDFFSFLPDDVATFGKTLDAGVGSPRQEQHQQQAPQAGLEVGSAAAAEFLVRPTEETNKIAKQSLDVQKKALDEMKKQTEALENKNNFVGLG